MVGEEIVIVGGGICGLAAALALHRKGIRSVVLERAESLRAAGFAITIHSNGRRALDQLGIGPKLRSTSRRLDVYVFSHSNRHVTLVGRRYHLISIFEIS
ncbi:hypothetical protein Nepgr_026733 [Nepenthes gracilis]|uniref:FAD-binding domain-containing protein n=1 Tax=Nepenthes gracilis TaxID=150966 RepID=A0AAD3T7E5_NEPGR|nr:hypothetical protein Nepgr_026733 [Nepenthes gracilis]